jgi:signal transduction histidine kinase
LREEPDAQEPALTRSPGRESRLREALDRLPQGVIVVDHQFSVDYVNRAATRLLGAGAPHPGEPLADDVGDVPLGSLLRRLGAEGTSSISRLAPLDDRVLCVEAISDPDSELVVLTVDDVTERERTRRAERRFVENAAHELRTPLAAIISVVDALDGGAKDEPAIRDRFLAHLRGHSERVARLATSLLALARVQSGYQEPRFELVALEPLLQRIVAELRPPPRVEVVTRVPETLAVLTDVGLVYHAVSNVLANAAKNTHAGAIAIEARAAGPTIELEISDSGPGMTAADIEHAFDRFFRAGGGDGQGFGLGLAIAKDALESIGGRIVLESPPGEGLRARIWLPGAKILS